MAASDNSTRRVIGVIALMALAAWALRGYVPGVDPAVEPAQDRGDNPASLAAVVALLSLAVAIIGFAILARMRDPRPARASAGTFARGSVGSGRPTWRFALIALAVIIALLLLIMLLSRWDPGLVEQPSSDPTAPQATDTAEPEEDDPAPPPADEGDPTDSDVIDYLLPPMLILLVLIVVGTAVSSRHRRRPWQDPTVDDDLDTPTAAPAESLVRAAEVGLAEIADLSREPREAIIACYAAMERELTRVPGAAPQDFDTPTEVLARAVANRALRADSATGLVDLFEEARFSPHVMTEAHRDAAVQVLHRVLAELPARVPVDAR